MSKISKTDVIAAILLLLPVVYLASVYTSLPGTVPMHFGLDGKPDRYGSKNELLGVQALMTGVGIFCYLLMKYLPKIDPKKTARYSAGTIQKIALGTVVFLTIVNFFVIYSVSGGKTNIAGKADLILPLTGLFFAFIGNAMNSIKPNYFAGIRTPWTLENEATWRATHRLAGRCWVAGGLLICILTLVLPVKTSMIIFFSITAVISLVPVIFSYLYYQKHKNDLS